MERKYYDLIESLIKEHRKYPGHETILGDIIDDVYQHAKVVITSVTNEDVILSYLNKVVSNSIVTVAKKKNLHRRPQQSIEAILAAKSVMAEESNTTFTKSQSKDAQPATMDSKIIVEERGLVDTEPAIEELVINEDPEEEIVTEATITPENDDSEEIILSEPVEICETIEEEQEFDEIELTIQEEEVELEESSTKEDISKEEEEVQISQQIMDSDPETISEQDNLTEVNSDDFSLDDFETLPEEDITEQEVETELTELTDITTEPVVDISLVDKMINGLDSKIEAAAEEEVISESEIEEAFVSEDIIEDLESLEPIESAEELPETLNEEAPDDELVEEDSITDITEISGELESSILESEPIITIQKEEEVDSDNHLISENIEEEIFDLQESEEASLEIIDSLEESLEPPLIDENAITELDHSPSIEISQIQDNIQFDYNKFDYEPNIEGYNSNEILSMLIDYNRKYPENKIIQICELKYAQKLSVTEIAQTLELEENKVLEILNEVIDMVKD